MKVIDKIHFLIASICLLYTTGISSQNMTTSPYSMFGIGELTDGQYGQHAAMGGVSVGMRDPILINSVNPAGLTGLDSLRLVADATAFVKNEWYSSRGTHTNATSGNLSSFSMGGRIMPRWYMSAGVYPYSTVGYYFRTKEPVEGTDGSYYYSTFEGSGGLSTASLSNAILLNRHLSLGVTLSYVFGNITQTETQESMTVAQKMYTNAFNARFGLQYTKQLANDLGVTVGLTFGYKQKLVLDNTTTVQTSSASTERSQKSLTQYIPPFVGAGASVTHKRITYGADYTFRKYSTLVSTDNRVTFRDVHEVKAGISYLPATYQSESYWRRVSYKAGVSLSNPYLSVSGKDGFSWRVSAGLGFPVSNGRIHAALFYDNTQLTGNTLRSSALGLSVSYTLSELFYKVKL